MSDLTMEEEKFVPSTEPVINYRGVKAMPFIIGNEAFEKLGTIGASSNLLVYLTTVFNMESFRVVMLLNIFGGSTHLAPLLGAYLADSYLGRYTTLAFASVSSLLGMMVLTITAMVPELHPPVCDKRRTKACVSPSTAQLSVLYISFLLLVIGAGGIRPCNLPFGADQFNPTTESGKRGMHSFFNWYFFTLTCAMMIAGTVIVYVQSNISWIIGLAIPTGLMCIAVALFFLGSNIYVKVKPQGSPLSSMAQVLVAAFKKRRLQLPPHPSCLFEHLPGNSINVVLPYTDQFRFIDKAAIITAEDWMNLDGSAANPWRLCSIQQVEEVKCVVRQIPIWASAIIYHTAMGQTGYVTLQALQSDRHLGNTSFLVPAASYPVISMLSLTIWIPIYDRIMVPLLRKITGKESGITLLQRTGVGIVLSICTMLVSALVESKRRHIALTEPTIGVAPRGGAISSMSALWFIPQLTLAGLSEAFNAVALFELFYNQFPENMRSLAGSLVFLGQACSSYLSGLLLFAVHRVTSKAATGNWLPEDLNKGKLDYFYCLIAAIGVVNFCYFLLCARWYKYKRVAGSTFESSIETKQCY